MSIQRITNIGLIVILLFAGWKFYCWKHPNFPTRFSENTINFQEKETELNELVLLVLREINGKEISNEILNLNKMSPLLKEKMEHLGFYRITFSDISNPCASKRIISFEVFEDWNIDTLNKVEVVYSPCDIETKKGYHWFDGRHIDVWGQGNNWKIISDTDSI
ncbi:hypothetical protein AR687_18540 [Flavobacteriaceae bacterium CRH]|nr:hypothetical protein AR687_18540 [Flavobacteriaceae bacterium CRH]